MATSITGHAIVKNEEQWVWFSIQSVIDFVDQLIIFDTGSTDKTVKIIKAIKSSKIKLELKRAVNSDQMVELRNEQIAKTQTPWFMLLDGDEVWTKRAIKQFVSKIKEAKPQVLGIVVPTIVPVGDLFHYQSESAGKYRLLGKTGHFNLRGYRKKERYHWRRQYPLEAYVDSEGSPIQEKTKNLVMLKNPYWHLTHLKRSNVDTHRKRKLEIGEKRKIVLPDVFFKTHPNTVPSPWISFTPKEHIFSRFFTPLVKLKRKLST